MGEDNEIVDVMGNLNEVVWVSFLISACIVVVLNRSHFLIALSLICFGFPSFVYSLLKWEIIDFEMFDRYQSIQIYVFITADILLILGIFKLISGGSPKSPFKNLTQDAQAVDLATLFVPRNDTNTYSRAEVLRDDTCRRLIERANGAGLEIIKQDSQSHSSNVWFRLDYILPSPGSDLSLTASVTVEIERFDFHRFEHLFTVTAQVGTKIQKRNNLLALDDAAIDNIHNFILNPRKKLRLKKRLRLFPWELWRPVNKIKRLRPDWVAILLTMFAFVALLLPIVGILLALGVAVGLYIRAQRRQTYVLTGGKPLTDPRSLRWMDSWQVSIFDLGDLSSTVQQGIITRLRRGGLKGSHVDVEKIGYWGTDSWVEREQIVINHRRAMGFVHVVPYKDVLYVAWESHLNSASWIEKKVAEGIDRVSGHKVVANRVIAGWHRLNEYDVSDSNFMAEWVHEAVKREIKLQMAEHKIDQEIDFTVQRESRKDTLAASSEEQPPAEKKANRFKRVS